MNKKQFYETPESELLQVRFEQNFLESPGIEDGNNNDPFSQTTPRQSMWHYMEEN